MDAKTATQNPRSHLKNQSSQILNHQSDWQGPRKSMPHLPTSLLLKRIQKVQI